MFMSLSSAHRVVDGSGCEHFMKATSSNVKFGNTTGLNVSLLASPILMICFAVCNCFVGQTISSCFRTSPFFARCRTQTMQGDDAVFEACQGELGTEYVPCNPYQALALAHLVLRPYLPLRGRDYTATCFL